jgi:chromosome partitioning protein
MILLIGGEKGGTGKTTLATNQAALRASLGRDVLLVDTDSQGSASYWTAIRAEAGEAAETEAEAEAEAKSEPALAPVASVQKFGQGLVPALRDLAGRYDDVIVDAGGRDSVELRGALVVAERVLIPVQASQFDVWTLERMAELVTQARGLNPALSALVVVNRASANPTVAETRQARAYLAEFDGVLALAETVVRDRIAYRRAAGAGRSVVELVPRDGKAAAEQQLLYAECFDERWLQKAA